MVKPHGSLNLLPILPPLLYHSLFPVLVSPTIPARPFWAAYCAHLSHRIFGFYFVQSFTSVVTPILSKPKPKVEPPPAADGKDATDDGPSAGTGDHSAAKNSQEEKMDVE